MLKERPKKLNAYLAGIVDAEGSFSISMKKQDDTRYGWVIDPVFSVSLHKDNKDVLETLRNAMTCGRVIEKTGQDNLMVFVVDNRRQLLEKVIPYFKRNKLHIKSEDFKNFADVVEALENKEHQTKDGFIELAKKVLSFQHAKGHRKYKLEDILSSLK